MPDRAVTVLCRSAIERLPEWAPRVVDSIRTEIREYAAVPLQQHIGHVLMLQEKLLRALMETRGPNADDLERAANLGRLRASQGISMEAVIGGYHVSDRELWKLLDGVAETAPQRALLPGLATIMWETIGPVSAAIADAHAAATHSAQARDLRLRYRLADLLVAGIVTSETNVLSDTLGFSCADDFTALLVRPAKTETVTPLVDSGRGGAVLCAQLDLHDSVLVLCQDRNISDLVNRIRVALPSCVIGAGMHRNGLRGAVDSIQDARLCVRLASAAQPVQHFESAWLAATMVAAGDRLGGLAAAGSEAARAHPHLPETVITYANSGFSTATTAEKLAIHPNTVAYRLDRWRDLTGWNPRTLDGVTRTLLTTISPPGQHESQPAHADESPTQS
ncbi:PucR family transcriptional regulator [Rhodococcus jostii]|uniref:PucR C-terminal helix-turn-helix domain-containing protein n=1 Tax=Rhodococcus jostii TaxID=132919 RepID=A0A1H4J9J5_RHOJO|nr:helix-turn-helix domain-containing protein [Rhodococcus jostii]SEB42837.1 PucR C-terminal helix-turn-helix domain-containing protein [Rhodococcus jostii]